MGVEGRCACVCEREKVVDIKFGFLLEFMLYLST